ncbi:hypothetical protein ACJX0J_023410, partial [Zea mays]
MIKLTLNQDPCVDKNMLLFYSIEDHRKEQYHNTHLATLNMGKKKGKKCVGVNDSIIKSGYAPFLATKASYLPSLVFNIWQAHSRVAVHMMIVSKIVVHLMVASTKNSAHEAKCYAYVESLISFFDIMNMGILFIVAS